RSFEEAAEGVEWKEVDSPAWLASVVIVGVEQSGAVELGTHVVVGLLVRDECHVRTVAEAEQVEGRAAAVGNETRCSSDGRGGHKRRADPTLCEQLVGGDVVLAER